MKKSIPQRQGMRDPWGPAEDRLDRDKVEGQETNLGHDHCLKSHEPTLLCFLPVIELVLCHSSPGQNNLGLS